MKKSKWSRKAALAFLIVIALVATACGSSGKESVDLPDTIPASEVPQGGEVVIGAEQEPDCLDFLDVCSGSAWGYWMVAVQTLPRTYSAERIYDDKKPINEWEWQATDLLDGEAKLETEPVQKITYKINEDAVWSDGTPITADDFIYTWDQLKNGENIYSRVGYTEIESVKAEGDDKKTVVVTMAEGEVFAGWKALFGGNYGILPAHLLEGKDRNALTKDGYTFSGGPFVLESWEKEKAITLVPNEKYWGDKPKLDKVTFQIQPDTTAEFKAFQDGEVQVIYPQPQIDVVDAINAGNLGDANQIVNPVTGNTEALWINNAAKPFDSVNVRQALGYSIDRDEIVEALFGDIGVTEAVNSFVPPVISEFADESAFSKYKPNAAKAKQLLEKDGYKKNSRGFYAKDGKELSITIITTEGNQRRKNTLEVLQDQLQEAGWRVKLEFPSADDLFGDIGPSGNYQIALFTMAITVLDPQNCDLFCSANIPTEDNGLSGNNWTRTDIANADKFLKQVDRELDEDKRIEASKNAERALAEEATSLPLDPLPNILIWNKKVLGPVDENPIQGPFWGLQYWGVKK